MLPVVQCKAKVAASPECKSCLVAANNIRTKPLTGLATLQREWDLKGCSKTYPCTKRCRPLKDGKCNGSTGRCDSIY